LRQETNGMRVIIAWALGLGLGANGLAMLCLPAHWYAAVPGVADTGPFNPHFIRDIGLAYVVAATTLVWFALDRTPPPGGAGRRGVPRAARAGAPVGRRGRTRARASAARRSADRLSAAGLGDLARVDAARRNIGERRSTMIKWFLQRWIGKFERDWNYDAGYLRDVLDADPRALSAFGKIAAISNYRKDVPPAVYCAAGIVGSMSEDCGPCTQLGIDMAQRQGVDPAVLRAIVARDFTAMPYEVALALRFAEASLHHAPEADDLRDEVVRRFGKRGLVSLAFAMTASRLYPTLKYAMGHGRACTRLTVGGETRPVRQERTKAA
jgi:hypothetical protein